MNLKFIVIALLVSLVFACGKTNKSEKAEMYEASELSSMMRDMVDFSKAAKQSLADGKTIDSIPSHFWGLKEAHATRDEHLEKPFQDMTAPYLNALKGIERADSQMYFYNASIDACKSCHSVYCGGPMEIINQL